MRPGPTNLITDIDGLTVGNANDEIVRTGTTVLLCERPMTASVAILGGAPGTRDIALLEPDQTVEAVDAFVLSGGSAFGLDAAGGVQSVLAARGRGFAVGDVRIPIVPGAILIDLLNGGDKAWGEMPPYHALGKAATESTAKTFALGRVGAGFGATLADGAGGLGSASAIVESGATVGALVAVNAVGAATTGDGNHFWAAPFEEGAEFGGYGLPADIDTSVRTKIDSEPGQNTCIGVIATDAALSKAQLKRLAIMAHGGYARAIWPSHTPLDGDLIFTVSSGARALENPLIDMTALGAAAAATMARAVARGVYEARR